MNNWNIAGNVGKDSVLRAGPNGDPVLNFSVAVEERAGGEKTTLWVDCSLWGKRGESLAQYVTKGSRVACSGRLSMRVYEGKPQAKLQVSELTLMGSPASAGEPRQDRQPARQQPARQAPPPTGGMEEDEIPF